MHFRFSSSVSPSILSLLQLSPFSGALTLLSPLDRETVPLISFSVTATDGGHPALEAQATVTITVGDYNDCPPVFEKPTLRARGEDSSSTQPILSFKMKVNPLLHQFFFSSVFEINRKIGCNRLPTHRQIFLFIPSYFKIKIFGHMYTIVTDMQQRVKC